MSAEELNARDMAIEEQLNFISKQSAPKELANKPLKIKSEVTKDMVDDFRAEQEGSIFHPPSVLPVLETFHPVAVADKATVEARKEALLRNNEAIDTEIEGRINAIPRIKEQYNIYMAELDAIRFDKKATRLQMKDAEDEKRRNTLDFERIMTQIESELVDLETQKRANISKINGLDKLKSSTDALIQQNEGEKARVERVNREAVKTFESEINALNKGININQQVGESDADYLQRIENMKGARYGQEVVVQAETFNIKRFKTKMKEIMSIPEHKLEKIIKYLEKDNMLYEANKKFPLIKTAIEKTYGVNPRFTKAGDEEDLYMFIYNTLTKQFQEKEETPVIVASVASKNSDLLAKSKTGFIPKSKLMAIYSSITGKKSFVGTAPQLANEIIRLRELEVPTDTRSVRTYSSSIVGKPFALQQEPAEQDLGGFRRRGRPTKEEAEFKKLVKVGEQRVKQQEAQDFLSRIGRESKEVTTSAFGEPIKYKITEGSKQIRPNLLTKMKEYEQQQVALEDVKPPKKSVQTKLPFAKGKGVEREFYPKLVPFGAITISPAQLFYYKLLRVREPTKHSIRGMPDVRVSEDMVYILMKIINGGTPSMTELKALSENEKSLYDAVITKAKLHKELPNTSTQSIDKLKRRLELCEGEWNAGNDNTLIKKELNSIIRQLTELKAISEVEGRKYLKQF
jgi:hypothetical protein